MLIVIISQRLKLFNSLGPEVWKLFDVSNVLTCIIEEALAARGKMQAGAQTATQGQEEEEEAVPAEEPFFDVCSGSLSFFAANR